MPISYLLEALNLFPVSMISTGDPIGDADGSAAAYPNPANISVTDLASAVANMTAAMFWAGT